MKYLFILIFIYCSSCSSYVYVVRHAEKATPMGSNTDVPLTAEGRARAIALRDNIAGKKIAFVLSSNTIRTKSTAQPTADYFHLEITTYRNPPDTALYNLIRNSKGSMLVVGHSNTVDDIVNTLCEGQMIAGDLGETEFDNLFVLKRKGNRFTFTRKRYGATAH